MIRARVASVEFPDANGRPFCKASSRWPMLRPSGFASPRKLASLLTDEGAVAPTRIEAKGRTPARQVRFPWPEEGRNAIAPYCPLQCVERQLPTASDSWGADSRSRFRLILQHVAQPSFGVREPFASLKGRLAPAFGQPNTAGGWSWRILAPFGAEERKIRSSNLAIPLYPERTLSVTSRPRRVSRARYTSPTPPAPSGARISYGQRCVPDFKTVAISRWVRGVSDLQTSSTQH
jgi:hypothetical protein